MPESSVSPMSRAQEESRWESRSASDPDPEAEKEAELVPLQLQAEQAPQGPLLAHKAMHITHGDAGQSHLFRWDPRLPPDAFLREVKRHFGIPSAIHVKYVLSGEWDGGQKAGRAACFRDVRCVGLLVGGRVACGGSRSLLRAFCC